MMTLGIEGGGTKTTWALLDEAGSVLAEGRESSANVSMMSEPELVVLLRRIAGALPQQPDAIGSGFAGLMGPDHFIRVERALKTAFPTARRLVAREDTHSGLYAAHADGVGVMVIAGTGSNVVGQYRGKFARAGGWGHLAGDPGSAWDVARTGLKAAFRAYDVTGKTGLLARAFLQRTGCNTMEQLIDWVMQRSSGKTEVAGLASCVIEAADQGDREARRVALAALEDLAECCVIVVRKLRCPALDVGLVGGLFEHVGWYRAAFEKAVRKRCKIGKMFVVETPGAVGAARLVSGEAFELERARGKVVPQPLQELSGSVTESAPAGLGALEKKSARALVELFIKRDAEVVQAVGRSAAAVARVAERAAETLASGGRMFYIGAGTSGRLGVLDASELPPTFGTEPERVQGIIAGGPDALQRTAEGAEDDRHAGEQAVQSRGVQKGDLVIGISASGRTPFVLAALEAAAAAGAETVLLYCNRGAVLPKAVAGRKLLVDCGAELLPGSTRLGAGTATKLVLNMISTIAMMKIGRVQQGRMVEMRAVNTKLRDRAARMVCELCGVEFEQAWRALERAGWNVRKAVAFLKAKSK